MGIPDNSATQNKNSDGANLNEATQFEKAVSDAVTNMKRGEDGKYILPDNTPYAVQYAAMAEQRRRDTQSEFTKIAQTKKALEAENSVLKSKVSNYIKVDLSKEQKEELEDLKFSDPDAWRVKMNQYENEARNKATDEINQEVTQISAETLKQQELERRKVVLSEFNNSHPDFIINDDIIKNDIPPRITQRLETGAISFEDFLQEAYDYTKKGKVIKSEDPQGGPNLSKVAGGAKPSEAEETVDIITSYNKEVF